MLINPVNINKNLVEIINSSQANNIQRATGSSFNSNFKTFDKTVLQNQSSIITSEKFESAPSIQEYNLKLQANTQLASLENSNRVFNESKTANVKFSKALHRYQTSDNDDFEDENNSEEIKTGKGYYIVINRNENDSNVDKIKNHTDNFYEKIKQAYNLGFRKEPGTLVNLVF